ncbi:MAG: DNA polymerase IV, partial [Pseudomonadota bacterium]
TGTAKLHHAPPAVMLAALTQRMETELGITGSVGLSHNKFLAKVASDLDKPRGFSIIGRAETASFLRDKPIRLIWGVGTVGQESLDKSGIRTFADLLRWDRSELHARFGTLGERLWHLARGEDYRAVSRDAPVKSVSHETTFSEDTADHEVLDGHLWRLAEKVSDRLKARDRVGRIVVLKVKKSDHAILSRRMSLPEPTQIADRIYRTSRVLFDGVANKGPFRLIGVGLSEITADTGGGTYGDLLDPQAGTRAKAERATDEIKDRFGQDAIIKGRALR